MTVSHWAKHYHLAGDNFLYFLFILMRFSSVSLRSTTCSKLLLTDRLLQGFLVRCIGDHHLRWLFRWWHHSFFTSFKNLSPGPFSDNSLNLAKCIDYACFQGSIPFILNGLQFLSILVSTLLWSCIVEKKITTKQ